MKVWVLRDPVILSLSLLGEKPLLSFPWGLEEGKEKVSLGLILSCRVLQNSCVCLQLFGGSSRGA